MMYSAPFMHLELQSSLLKVLKQIVSKKEISSMLTHNKQEMFNFLCLDQKSPNKANQEACKDSKTRPAEEAVVSEERQEVVAETSEVHQEATLEEAAVLEAAETSEAAIVEADSEVAEEVTDCIN